MNNIYVLWWQGIENAPDIIKICHNSLLKNYNPKTQKIHLITKDNYKEYVNIPRYIMDKVEKKIISITHLSDIIRSMILYNYGGLWIDASIFITGKIDNSIFKKEFFIKKNPMAEKDDITSKWQGFLMGGKKGYKLFKIMVDFWLDYWQKETQLIEYLLIDHIFYIAYKENLEIHKDFDNNESFYYPIDYFQKMLNKKYNEKLFNEICSNEKFIKLTYKLKLKEEQDDNLTYYGYLKKEYK